MDVYKITQVISINSSLKGKTFDIRKNDRISYEEIIKKCKEVYGITDGEIGKYALIYSDVRNKTIKEVKKTKDLDKIFTKCLDNNDQSGEYLYKCNLEFGLKEPLVQRLKDDAEEEDE